MTLLGHVTPTCMHVHGRATHAALHAHAPSRRLRGAARTRRTRLLRDRRPSPVRPTSLSASSGTPVATSQSASQTDESVGIGWKTHSVPSNQSSLLVVSAVRPPAIDSQSNTDSPVRKLRCGHVNTHYSCGSTHVQHFVAVAYGE